MGDIGEEALAGRLAVTLKKAECLVKTLRDAFTDAPGSTVANKLEQREAEAPVNTFNATLVKKEGQNTLGHNERCANRDTLGHRRSPASSGGHIDTWQKTGFFLR